MEPCKILIIEDEQKVASFIRKGLQEQKYEVDVVFDGTIGLRKAINENFQLIILDLNLPGINGFEVCKEVRLYKSNIPILMLTALGTTKDKLEGFDAGADDYLLKPFEFKELLARIKALLKRTSFSFSQLNILKISDLQMNLDTKNVLRGGKKIDLTAKEFQLLEYFMRNKEKVIDRAKIAEDVWGIAFDSGTNVIDVYINFLRNKIDKNFDKKLIHTLIGMGYALKENG